MTNKTPKQLSNEIQETYKQHKEEKKELRKKNEEKLREIWRKSGYREIYEKANELMDKHSKLNNAVDSFKKDIFRIINALTDSEIVTSPNETITIRDNKIYGYGEPNTFSINGIIHRSNELVKCVPNENKSKAKKVLSYAEKADIDANYKKRTIDTENTRELCLHIDSDNNQLKIGSGKHKTILNKPLNKKPMSKLNRDRSIKNLVALKPIILENIEDLTRITEEKHEQVREIQKNLCNEFSAEVTVGRL